MLDRDPLRTESTAASLPIDLPTGLQAGLRAGFAPGKQASPPSRTLSRLAAALLGASLSLGAASAQDWDLGPNPGQAWLPDQLTFVGQDQFVWATTSGAAPRHLLMRAHAQPQGWVDRQEVAGASGALTRRIAGGEGADRLFALEGLAGGSIRLRAYDPWSTAPGGTWTATWSQAVRPSVASGVPPAMRIACDRAGDGVVTAVAREAAAGGGAEVSLWNAQSGALLWSQVVVGTGLDALEVSADGQTIAVASGLHWTALDRQGQTITHHYVPASLRDLSLSDDGQVLAAATLGGTRLWRRDAAGFYEADWFAVHSGQPTEALSAQVDLSADGSVLAVAHWRYLHGASTAFELWDTNQQVRLWQSLRPLANPARQDLPTQVAVHPSGERAAFGAWSDEVWPEVEFVRADGSGGYVSQAIDLPGSVRDLSLNGDGSRLAIAYKQGHAQAFGGVGGIRVLSTETPELTWVGPARPGASSLLQAHRPDAWFTLFLVGPPASTPSVVGGVVGELHLLRSQLTVRAAINDAQGNAQCPWDWPIGVSGPSGTIAVQTAYRTPTGTVLGESVLHPLLLP